MKSYEVAMLLVIGTACIIAVMMASAQNPSADDILRALGSAVAAAAGIGFGRAMLVKNQN